jgi:hypothetical protein
MRRIVGERLYPIARLRCVHTEVFRRLLIGYAAIFDQARCAKLEFSRKMPSLHDHPPLKHLTRCLRNRMQAKHAIVAQGRRRVVRPRRAKGLKPAIGKTYPLGDAALAQPGRRSGEIYQRAAAYSPAGAESLRERTSPSFCADVHDSRACLLSCFFCSNIYVCEIADMLHRHCRLR